MSGRVIVVQASSSEDESMCSPVVGGDDSKTESEMTKETTGNAENKACFKYDREDMLKLYNHPSAKVRPSILSPEFDMVVENGEGGKGDAGNHKLWSPELWIQSIWNPEPRQNSSMAVSGSGSHNWSGRRPGDHDGHGQPLNKKKQIDRLKTENEDGIVLSPQRRSFVAGCQVASSSAAASANTVGSQGGTGGAGSTTQLRRSTSPNNAGGDDRQQQGATQNVRSSFRSRGGANVVNVPISQSSQVQTSTSLTGGMGYGRGDRVENWRDRSSYSSSSFGRGNMGKDAPAPINSYARSRGGGTNSWNPGGGRRSYGGGGYHHNENESLPEWVTEGPSDMYETMELHGFDDEEHPEMQMEQNNGVGQKRGPGRFQQRSPTGGLEYNGDKERSNRRSTDRNEQSQPLKRASKVEQAPRKSLGDGDKTGKMPAEALVDGFDIGDMAQFLSVAGADFDSISNGDMQTQPKIGKVIPGPTTPSAASRFSKFFTPSGMNSGNVRAASEGNKAGQVTKGQPQSVNIMELLSKAAVAGDSNQVKQVVAAGSGGLPGAKSLDEIEAAYKSKSVQKSGADGSPNKVLQELFQSARSVNAHQGSVQDQRLNAESHQKGDEGAVADIDKQPRMNQLADHMNQQQALEMLQKSQQATVNVGASTVKGNPLADPNQQQHFMDALRKLHIQQQQIQTSHQHGDMAHRHSNPGPNEAPNPFLAAYPQLAGLQHLLQQQQQAMQMGNLQAALSTSGRVPSPLGVMPGVVPMPPQQAAGATATNPAFSGFLPPANIPPPPITQHDLLLAHTQSIYQRAMMTRKLQQGMEDQLPQPRPSVIQQGTPTGGGKLPTAFLPTSVIKQMHGGIKPNKDGEESAAGVRPIVKQQHPLTGQQEQVSPTQINDYMRHLQQQQSANKPMLPVSIGGNPQAMAPPPSLTPQDLQRLIDQTQRQRQHQHQERVLLEQYAKAQQQLGANSANPMNPTTVSAALALQNNPVFVQMLKAQAMQAQQMAMLQQQAAAAAGVSQPQPIPASAAVSAMPAQQMAILQQHAAGSGMSQPQPISASTAVSAISNAAQLVRARGAAAAPNPELMRHVFQQQQQQMILHQLRQQTPGDVNLLNRILTGQVAQQQHQMAGVSPQSASSFGGLHFSAPGMVDAKPMTLEELERLHKQTAAMQQPQS